MDYTKLDTGDISFSGWIVKSEYGKGTVKDDTGAVVAEFDVDCEGHVALQSGDYKFADLALVALRSFVRYGQLQTA
jgi:hypothetical protein